MTVIEAEVERVVEPGEIAVVADAMGAAAVARPAVQAPRLHAAHEAQLVAMEGNAGGQELVLEQHERPRAHAGVGLVHGLIDAAVAALVAIAIAGRAVAIAGVAVAGVAVAIPRVSIAVAGVSVAIPVHGVLLFVGVVLVGATRVARQAGPGIEQRAARERRAERKDGKATHTKTCG